MLILWYLALLGYAICFIIVLIKLFQTEGALKGVLGLICNLYAFIWGWLNAGRLGLKNIMLIWTLLLVICIILYIMVGASYMTTLPTNTP